MTRRFTLVAAALLMALCAPPGAAGVAGGPVAQKVAAGKPGRYSADKGKLPNYHNGISGAARTIVIEGEIGENFAAQLALEIGRFPEAGIEIGDSPGGLIDEAIQAGRILRSQGKTVTVKGSCASACVLVFAGGKQRKMETGSALGVHQSTWGGRDLRMTAEEVQEASGRIGQFYIDMGISAEILVLQLRTPKEDMSWLSPEDARGYGFID